MGVGIVLIIAGVLTVELGSQHAVKNLGRGHLMAYLFLLGPSHYAEVAPPSRCAWQLLASAPTTPPSPAATSWPFAFLTLALTEGLGLGVAYGIWAASELP